MLIQLSRQLAKPTEEELAKLPEIHGCESRLWFEFQATPRKVHAYSDARLMQGIYLLS
ncbi:Fe-S metabolism associated SufE [Actinobacillus equuli]|nr:Fe-S metabolism associated SufE [Actinobacillus equuli]